jgi:hypothetical protein
MAALAQLFNSFADAADFFFNRWTGLEVPIRNEEFSTCRPIQSLAKEKPTVI